MVKTTPFFEGRAAGYRGRGFGGTEPTNPYRKGLPQLWNADQIVWAQAWDDGYLFGQREAWNDTLEKRREACRA